MPTLASGGAHPSDNQPHRAREVAESFGVDSERYDRARPRYPDALIERIVAEIPGTELLAVGSGTGIDARQFQAAGCRVLGVEPDARMAAFAQASGVPTEVASFEDWEPADRDFDAVVAGMAWHWVDPVEGAAKAARLLRPGGRLTLFWYVFQPPAALSEAFAAVYRRVLPDMPMMHRAMPDLQTALDAYSVFVVKAEDGIAQAETFGKRERCRFDWELDYTRKSWLDLVPTFGGHSNLEPEARAELLAGIGEAVDAVGGHFTAQYAAVALTTVRHPG